jgi:RNA polymerase sigma factor (sigma-70 family)
VPSFWQVVAQCKERRSGFVFKGVRMTDENDFTEFVRDHGDALLRTARLLIRDATEAQDVLQTALLRLSRRWPVQHPHAYVRRSLVNLARDRTRRQHLVPEPAEAREDRLVPLPDHADAHASQAALEQLLSLLPVKQRAAVVLRVVEGMSEAEAAAAMRCRPGTVASNLSRGLARLRAHLPEGATHD